MDRRTFLSYGMGTAAGALTLAMHERPWAIQHSGLQDEFGPYPPAFSIIPVVGDGKWVWTKPPEGEKGYLEPRKFELQIGIQLQGRGSATDIKATTAAPVEVPEQSLDDARIETSGCAAELRSLAPESAQLMLAAPGIVEGQLIGAVAKYRLTLHKEYMGYERDQFPAGQKFAKDFRRVYMYDSPGIQTRQKVVRDLAAKVGGQANHPWEKAHAYYTWVWENIKPLRGPYTSVIEAIRDKVGDCEERAAVFVALCRASEIPARLVWVPNHNWAEFCLHDEQGEIHWIPAHTSCYSWFGWTGAHELVLQKGDTIHLPEKSKPQRLAADWMQWSGVKPKVRYYAELRPLPPEGSVDAGPGERVKDEKGEWVPAGRLSGEKFVRR